MMAAVPPTVGPIRPVPAPMVTEVLAGLMLGSDRDVEPLPPPGPGLHAALNETVLAALSRPPCVVSFSGGRDSSAILAVAAAAARRHGLPLPVPVIMRHPRVPASDETDWQELVLRHLGLADHAEVLTFTDELDALGPLGTSVLRRHGLLWPGNAYLHVPVLELARGGSLLTGVGGDEMFHSESRRQSLRRRAFDALPTLVRAEIWLRRSPPDTLTWLTDAGDRTVRRALALDAVEYPHDVRDAVDHWHASRAFSAIDGTLHVIAAEYGVMVRHPFIAPHVLAELRALLGPNGFPSRTEAMRRFFGDLLPDALLARETKAVFDGVIFGAATRRFAADWKGAGLDRRLVDPGKLRAEVARSTPDGRTLLLLQDVWLTQAGSVASSASTDRPRR